MDGFLVRSQKENHLHPHFFLFCLFKCFSLVVFCPLYIFSLLSLHMILKFQYEVNCAKYLLLAGCLPKLWWKIFVYSSFPVNSGRMWENATWAMNRLCLLMFLSHLPRVSVLHAILCPCFSFFTLRNYINLYRSLISLAAHINDPWLNKSLFSSLFGIKLSDVVGITCFALSHVWQLAYIK